MSWARTDFPEGFVFGAATSAYQIEGAAHGGAGVSEWDTFAATPGNVARREDGALACDHYHRFEEDFDVAAGAGLDAYRFSTSWARVMPEGKGAPNLEGLDFYDRLVDAMLTRGLAPWATLYHWELPAPMADIGGWRNREVALRFADFADVIAGRIGDRLAAVAPINEPWCVAWLSHFIGQHAPGLRDIRATARAMHHVLVGHAEATAALRARGQRRCGLVVNMEWAAPADDTGEARAAATLYDEIYNRWFIEAVRLGRYPERALAALSPHMPKGWEADMDAIAAPVDWIGLNYYTRKLLAPVPGFPGWEEAPGPLPKTQIGWEVYPEGLGAFLRRTAAEHAAGLPIYVTENGLANDDRVEGGVCDDPARTAYLDAHLAEARAAIADGVDLRGYFVWSLLDNYEWSLGYAPRFGLTHVDFETMARTPKTSLQKLAEALAR